MAGGHGSLGLPLPLWLFVGGFMPIHLPVWTLNLQGSAPIVYSGPHGSYFGFALDFYQDSKGSMNVVVGAPRANTSQANVIEAGAVYLCPWVPSDSKCTPIEFDTKGDQEKKNNEITMQVFKSKQWFGASVNTWKDFILACAPLQHWNAIENEEQATKTPVGSCFLATEGLQRFSEYSPCRETHMQSSYQLLLYKNDRRYCELGFSAAISNTGKALIGAPGGYYFGGMIYSVNLSAIQALSPSVPDVKRLVSTQRLTNDYVDFSYEDSYQGYSVAWGEFNEDSESAEYVLGVPNKSKTQGTVEILTLKYDFRVLWTIPSEQIASYFGHTVAVADINGDGKDDILVGAPLFMERHLDSKLHEVGRVYLYLQRKTHNAYRTPWQTLTGTDVYGRFGMAIAPLGDIDQDGYIDIAVGAPFAGQDEGGRVYIYHGCSEGLSTSPKQILENPFSGPSGFGFAIRGASDIDANGYPDVLVGAYRASKVALYRAQPVVMVKARLVLPDALNPENKLCEASGAQVSCFVIQMCVRVSGKGIPQKIDLHAELQLDRMKQKFGRRVFLLQDSQSSQTFLLELSGKSLQTCWNVTAYLRDETEFKDKLSPIIVSLNFSQVSASRAGELQPVLYGQLMVQEQTRIILNCGDDNICIPNLKLSAYTSEGSLLIGADNALLIQAVAVNDGEGAYEAELMVELPAGAYFQRANSSTQNLICNSRKENETRLVACEVGNPMKAGTELKVDVELSVSQLENAEDTISFTLQLKSKNTLNSSSNVVLLPVPVKAVAKMELLGISAPAVIVIPVTTEDYKNKSKKVDDYGPKIEHVYRLQNAGPSTVSGAELLVDFPNKFWGGFLLYITRVSTEGNIICSPMNETNPLQLELQEPMTTPSSNVTGQRRRWRQRRDVSPATLEQSVVVNCSSQICAVLHCQVGLLERGHGAVVTVHAILWLESFHERPLEQFLIQSQAQFNVSGMPYHIQPEVLPSGSSLVETLVEWVNPDAERKIPVWWIIVAVLVGLLLLAAFIIILRKTGFFKRKRPPTEDEEQLTNDPGAQSPGEGQ